MHDMTSQTFLTVAEAAVRVDKSRQTLFDKIKRGQLSATVNADGIKVIDVSELLRVFGTLLSDDDVKKNQANRTGQSSSPDLTSTLQLELELSRLRLVHAEKELATANRQLEDMRVRERQSIDDRTQLLGVIERQTLLLAAPRPARATAAPKAAPAKTPVRPKAAPVAKPKPSAKATIAKTPEKPVQTRKTASATAAKKSTAKPVAKAPARAATRSKPVARTAPKTVAKKATQK
jgi:hypothetical protein